MWETSIQLSVWRLWASEEEVVQGSVRTQSCLLLLWTQNIHTHTPPLYTNTHKLSFPLWEDKSLLWPCLFVCLKPAYSDLLDFCEISQIEKNKAHTLFHNRQHSSSLFTVKTYFTICLLGPVYMRLDFVTIRFDAIQWCVCTSGDFGDVNFWDLPENCCMKS